MMTYLRSADEDSLERLYKQLDVIIDRMLVKGIAAKEQRKGRCKNQRSFLRAIIGTVLANLYLHYRIDRWLEIKFPYYAFERYMRKYQK